MKRSLLVAALAGVALVSLPFEARAQISTVVKPLQFGIAAGAAIPTGDFADFVSTGFNGTVTLGLNPAAFPLGIRIDGAYSQFGFKGVSGDARITSVTGNLVYKMPMVTVSPYLIGGAGWYNLKVSGASGSVSDFGFNVGAGLSMGLSGFDTFVEARYNHVRGEFGSTSWVPITFGIMF